MVHLKSHRELEKMRHSADLVGRTLAEVARHIEPGVTTEKLDAVAEAFIRAAGATPAFKGYRVGSQVFPASACISVNDAVVHGIPDGTVLREGDVVTVDIGVKLDGYYGDSAYTFAVGTIDEATQRLLQVTYASLYDGIAKAVVGNRIGDIGYAVYERCAAAGYGVVYDLVGHGIGRSLHEDPQVPNVGERGKGKKLKEGLTICIEPMINGGTAEVITESDGWTVRTADGKPSAHYEHMVAVRRGQPEMLTTFAYIEEVIEPPYTIIETVPSEDVSHG